jgi:ferritin-like metal-binding protein YciE
MADTTARDAKLIQYLNEAYGKEKELVIALEAHIAMTTRMPYKKRLREHLKETRAHARAVERRIKQLGGKAEAGPPVPDAAPDGVAAAAAKVTEVASKGLAAAKGPLHMIRGTGEAEKMLKNAKSEYWNEFEEIATYYAIETVADSVGDKETASLAKSIRREEERMARFLEKQIPTLAKAVVQEEIPAAERRRASSSRTRRSSASRSNGSSRAPASKSRSTSSSRASSSSRSTATRKTSRSGGNGSSGAKKRSARKPAASGRRSSR